MIAGMSILSGLLLDWIFSLLSIDPLSQIIYVGNHQMREFSYFQWLISGIFLILLLLSLYRKFIKLKIKANPVTNGEGNKIHIAGMTCNHCIANVRKTIEATQGVKSVMVSLQGDAA